MTIGSRFTKITDDSLSLMEDLSNIRPYTKLTNDINITVWPEFIDSKITMSSDLYIWAYHVHIENKSSEAIQLISRYWRIIDEKGGLQEVRGEGVIGKKPKIMPNSSYQYTSGVHLNYPSGIMSGTYKMKKGDNEFFDVEIPTFSLDVPNIKNVIN